MLALVTARDLPNQLIAAGLGTERSICQRIAGIITATDLTDLTDLA